MQPKPFVFKYFDCPVCKKPLRTEFGTGVCVDCNADLTDELMTLANRLNYEAVARYQDGYYEGRYRSKSDRELSGSIAMRMQKDETEIIKWQASFRGAELWRKHSWLIIILSVLGLAIGVAVIWFLAFAIGGGFSG